MKLWPLLLTTLAPLVRSLSLNVNGNKEARVDSFATPPQRLYIEDTDAYGVVYNANYMYCYERALFDHLGVTSTPKSCFIHSFENQSFLGSPTLGHDYIVHGERDGEGNWNMRLSNTDDTVTYNKISGVKILGVEDPLSHIPETVSEKNGDLSSTYRVYPHYMIDGMLPLTPIFTFMERIRTDCIGGSANLNRLREEDGILLMVTTVRQVSSCSPPLQPGDNIVVGAHISSKRKGMILECQQTVRTSEGDLIAQAVVDICHVKANSFRPTNKIPEWLKEIYQHASLELDKVR